MFSQLHPGDRGSRHGTTPRWPDRLARRARDLAHGTWKRAFGEEEPAALGENARYRTGFLAFQRWSPWIVPPLLGGAILTLTLVLYAHGMYAGDSPVAALGPALLVGEAVLLAILFTVVLVVLPNDALWLGALVAGSVLYLVFMLSAEYSVAVSILPMLAVAGLGARYAHRHQCEVPEGCITLTSRKASYLRTLYPGKNILWPGEQVLGTLETGQRIYISPTQKTQVRAPDGTQYRASASAIVAYAFIPTEVRGVARGLDTWERDLHQLVAVALREALQQWSTNKIVSAELAPAGLVARWVLEEVRGWARASGIWIAWVRVCHLQLGPAWDDLEHPPTPTPRPASRPVRPATGASYAAYQTRPPSAPQLPSVAGVAVARDNGSVNRPIINRPMMEESPTMEEPDFAHNPDLDQLPPDALADLYEAVREGRINDPDTIRQIAQALAHLALEPPLDAELPYDPAAASDALLQFAARIERHNDSQARGPTGTSGPASTDLFAPTQDLILPMGPSR